MWVFSVFVSILVATFFRILNFFLDLPFIQMELFGYRNELDLGRRRITRIFSNEGELRGKFRDLGISVYTVEIWNLWICSIIFFSIFRGTPNFLFASFQNCILLCAIRVFCGFILLFRIIICIININNKKPFSCYVKRKRYGYLLPCSISHLQSTDVYFISLEIMDGDVQKFIHLLPLTRNWAVVIDIRRLTSL